MPTITRSAGGTGGLLIAIIAVAIAVATALFRQALPTVVLQNRIPRAEALRRADSVFGARALASSASRRAVRFQADDSLLTFVDLAGGGKDTLEALVRGQDVTPYTWSVRAFTPEDPHEARLDFDPGGRVVGFERRLPESDAHPPLSPDTARTLADTVLTQWLGESSGRWRLATSSYETRKTSGRVDRTFTFERIGRTVAGAPIRLDIVIAGDLAARAHRYVVIPETFQARYREMRYANTLLEIIDTIAIFALIITVVVVLRKRSRDRMVRWRAAFVVGGAVGVLLVVAGLNDLPLSWFDYDTASSPLVFQAQQLIGAIAGGVAMGAVVALTLAAAESAARRAFPDHLDWWKLWSRRGTRQVAGRVLGGYTVAAIALAYVTVFYLITRRVFGWWVPTEMLDDPNLIATPFPWISGIAMSLQAGVWEETLFRVLPLSLLSVWVGDRAHRRWWMAGGVVATALVFGFAHSNYTSWPPYSRGIEIFIDAAFWAVLVVQFGAIVTVVGHFLYDLTLFGLFAAAGTALQYRISAVVIAAAILAPIIAVLWKRVRQGRWTEAAADASFGSWAPAAESPPVDAPPRPKTVVLSARAERLVIGVVVVALVAAVFAPSDPVLGPAFTASRARAIAVADSIVVAHGVRDPSSWRRLAGIGTDTLPAWPRFLRANHAEYLARALASTYAVPTWWTIRYVHTNGSLASRIEEWRVRVRPDGSPLDVRHIVPDSAPGATPSADDVRRIAGDALAKAGFNTARLKETNLDVTDRPLRRDATVTYTDSSVVLPDGAAARAWVSFAGADPLVVRRGIELPEAFLRSDRQRQDLRLSIAAVAGLLLVGGLIAGIVLVIRGRPVVVADVLVARRGMTLVVVVVAVTLIGRAVNALPSALFEYDSASTWSNFTTRAGLQILFAAIPALLILGLWLVTRALRQRVGIPAGTVGPSEPRLRTSFVAGLGLGGVFALATLIAASSSSDIPLPPHTLLNDSLPWLSQPISTIFGVAAAVASVPIPFLVIAGASRRIGVRILLVIVFAVLLAAVGAAAADRTITAMQVALSVAALAVVIYVIPAWGRVSAMAWLIAGLSELAFAAVHGAVHGPTAPEQIGSALTALLSFGLLIAIATMTNWSAEQRT